MNRKLTKILVHLHLYYHNQIDYFINKLNNISDCDWDLYVTVCEENEQSKEKILNLKPDAKIIKTENIGYDIYPFIQVCRMINLDDYDYVLKIHTKNYRKKAHFFKEANVTVKGYSWRNDLVNSLIGSKRIFSRNIKLLNTKNIGIILSKKFLFPLKNRPEDTFLLEQLKSNIKIKSSYNLYCAGTMFIIRAGVLKPFINSDITTKDFIINEQSYTCDNGKYVHAAERIFTILADNAGYEICARKIDNKLFKDKLKTILQNVFSIKNSKDKKHKIITIFGIKTKFKINKKNKLGISEKVFSIKSDKRKMEYALDGEVTVGKKVSICFIKFKTCNIHRFIDLLMDKLIRHYNNTIAIVAIVKNEAPYIKEWIEYHKLIGINKFYIYDNESNDNLKDILQSYIKSGEVIYKYVTGYGQQCICYNDAIKKYKFKNRYMAFIDIDEFISLDEGFNLKQLLDDNIKDNVAGLAIQWCVYGSSGHIEKPEGLVIENYIMRANGEFDSKSHSNKHIKTICNPRKVLNYGQCHYPMYYEPYYSVNIEGNKITGPFCFDICWNKIRLNHYFTKSFEEYKAKRERGRASTRGLKWDINEFYEADVNDVKDESMQKYVSAIKNRIMEK